VVSIARALAGPTRPLLLGRGARFSRFYVIGVFIGLRLGILGRTTTFTLRWGICTLILSLSLGGPASFPLGWLLAGRVCGGRDGLLVL
jgi:hypothetical protein